MLVTDLLVESFPDVLNVEFTAGMEDELDLIEEGREHWVAAMRRFWTPFAKDLERAEVEMRDVKREERPTDLACEKCGKPMVIKWGRRGEFLACSGYPECRNTTNFTRDEDGTIKPVEPEITDRTCDKCGRPMQVRFGRFGKFLGCSGYPECKSVQPLFKPVPTGIACLACGQGELLERRSQARQRVLQLQPLSGLHVRGVGSARDGAVSALRRAVRHREARPSAAARCGAVRAKDAAGRRGWTRTTAAGSKWRTSRAPRPRRVAAAPPSRAGGGAAAAGAAPGKKAAAKAVAAKPGRAKTGPQEAGAPQDGGRRAADGREGPRGARHAMRRA